MNSAKTLSRLLAWILVTSVHTAHADNPPERWIDEDTGHEVIWLTRRPGSNVSLYFHQNPFTAEGDKMVFTGGTEDGQRAFTVDLDTLAIEQITDQSTSHEVVAPKSRTLYYRNGRTIYATHLDTKETRTIGQIPEDIHRGPPLSVNADESLLASSYAIGVDEYYEKPRSVWFTEIYEAHLPNGLYTVDIETGKIRIIHTENEWLGHIQFSPADPQQLMFCHEGPWHLLDRIWLIRTDGPGLRHIHPRTVEGEIAGHEFWGPGGERIWFDLQIPRGENFYLAGAHIESEEEILYPLDASEWSYHYNISSDGTLFCGDGGDRRSVAGERAGQWIYLYRPEGEELEVERLVNLEDHDYSLEPNVHFTPDGKWVVFRSNMHGSAQVYAVAVEKEAE